MEQFKTAVLGFVSLLARLMIAAIFLASAASDFMTGQMLYIDGGLTASV